MSSNHIQHVLGLTLGINKLCIFLHIIETFVKLLDHEVKQD